ncbi:porin family protein [Pedobacter frigoris]|uniref:porin family protein n=1 Tax=Pedobacter frigoris TaxID=2571272 RepID=UPI00292F4A4F|nr:porin family protein [Pedobacter frigoris]
MRKISYLVTLLLLAILAHKGYAQSYQGIIIIKKNTHFITAGYNFGATAPYTLPNTIRKIEKYTLQFTPSVGYEFHRKLNKKWGVGSGVRVDVKGMKITDSVQYFHTILTMDDGEFEGDFSGTNQTTAKNTYLTVPIYGTFQSGRWHYRLGGYVAYALSKSFSGSVSNGYIRKGNSLGEKVFIDESKFDFSDEMKSWDWGLHAAVGREIGHAWSINLNIQAGIDPIFPSSFRGVGYKLRNINLNIGAAFNLSYL